MPGRIFKPKMAYKLSKSIKNLDLFGQHAQINFSEGKKTHTTLLGGFLSLWIMLAIGLLILFKTTTMILKEDNKVTSYTSAYDVDGNNGINYNQTKMLTYHVLRK